VKNKKAAFMNPARSLAPAVVSQHLPVFGFIWSRPRMALYSLSLVVDACAKKVVAQLAVSGQGL